MMKKRLFALALTLAMALSLAIPVQAAQAGQVKWLPDGWRITGYTVSEGMIAAENAEGKGCYIDAAGKVVLSTNYDYVSDFSDGRAVVGNLDANNEWVYGCIDKSGKLVVPLEYSWFYSFSDGLAMVSKGDKCGYIDTSGKLVIPMKFDGADSFHDGIAIVSTVKDDRLLYGCIDKSGTLVVPMVYPEMGIYADGMIPVLKDDDTADYLLYGYINAKNEVIVPFQNAYISTFCEGLGAMTVYDAGGEKTCQYIDTAGNVAIAADYDWLDIFSEGLAVVSKDDKLACIDKTGAIAIPFSALENCSGFGDTVFFQHGLLVLADKDGDTFCCVDKKGKMITSGEYDGIKVLDENLLSVSVYNEKTSKWSFGLLPLTSDNTTQPGTGFTDVKSSDYFAAPVNWAVEKAITNGTSATKFSPNETCINAQILTFLWRAMGCPEPEEAAASDAYYAKAAQWAAEQGIADEFDANIPCTRAMTVDYLWKTAGAPDNNGKTPFSDVTDGTDLAKAVAWAVEKGVTTGTSADKFSPDETCTRGQIVTFLYRDMGK